MVRSTKNISASIRQKLLNLSRSEKAVFNVVLVNYGLERLIYRLSISEYRNRFVLKGGMLVTLWTEDPNRVTRDADFLAYSDNNQSEMVDMFVSIMNLECDDGLDFDTDGLTVELIKEDQQYEGLRLKSVAYLGKTIIPITVDIGFGDAVSDENYEIDFPSLLDFPVVTIRAYSPASVVAEKFQAMVALGLVNSRMKDYYDIWSISESMSIDISELDSAIWATFNRRQTAVPIETPAGLSEEFVTDIQKQRQWNTYISSVGIDKLEFSSVVAKVWDYIEPSCKRLLNKEEDR